MSTVMTKAEFRALPLGTQISFKTYHTSDYNTYEGTLVGFGSYSVVNPLMDILPYYQGVKKSIIDLEPMTELDYFILEYLQEDIVDGSQITKLFVCAIDWLQMSTVQQISLKESFDIRIYNKPETEASKVIALLQAHGYTCNKIEK